MPSRKRPMLTAMALMATISIACSDGSGPSQSKGMAGTWRVTADPFSTNNGRGSCQMDPSTFDVTIDSTASAITATLNSGTLVQLLLCGNGDALQLFFSDTLAPLTDSTGTHPAYIFQVGDSASTEYLIFGVPAQVAGDSISSRMVNLETSTSQIIGTAAWAATRQ